MWFLSFRTATNIYYFAKTAKLFKKIVKTKSIIFCEYVVQQIVNEIFFVDSEASVSAKKQRDTARCPSG